MGSLVGLNDMIGVSDLNNRMVDALLQALLNVGGDEIDVERLMDNADDALERRATLMTDLAKRISNERLWSLANERARIGNVDYRATVPEYLDTHRNVPAYIAQSQIRDPGDQAVHGFFTYELRHYDRHETIWGVAKMYANVGVHVANWRELLAYGSYLHSRQISLNRYEIFALGSPVGDSSPFYPRLTCDDPGLVFTWKPFEKGFRPISRRRFYLVRHSSATS